MITILIVCSNMDSLSGLESALKCNDGIEVFRIDSGEATLKIISGKAYNLVISDEKLSDMTGLELARKIILINPMINYAVVSHLSPEDFHEASEGLGILMQLPPEPDKDDAEKLIRKLNNILNPNKNNNG